MGNKCCKCQSSTYSSANVTVRSFSSYNSSIVRSRGNDAITFETSTNNSLTTLAMKSSNQSDLGKDYRGGSSSTIGQDDRIPTFLRRLNDLNIRVGTRTRFLIELDDATGVQVRWYKNNVEANSDRYQYIHEGGFFCLDIVPVTLDDEGLWVCTAQNYAGKSSTAAHLSLTVPKAFKKPIFVEALRAVLTERGIVSLECKVIGVPTPKLRWFKDDKEIKAGDIFALTANSNEDCLGVYTCEATNVMGTATSTSKIQVAHTQFDNKTDSLIPYGPPPKFLKGLKDASGKIGDVLFLECQVEVPPWPRNVGWYNDNGVVNEGSLYHLIADGLGMYGVEIKSLRADHGSTWKCVATSSTGAKAVTTCIVSVSYPKNYRVPRFLESLRAIMTDEGLVSFECKVIGYPTPQLCWFKDGKQLQPGDVYELTGSKSLGSYCCVARNCMGEASSIAELTIEDIQNQLNESEKLQLTSNTQPPRFLIGLKSAEANINESFVFMIKVINESSPSISWYKENEELTESNRYQFSSEDNGTHLLNIISLEIDDQAEWKCVAVNKYGQTVTSSFLKLVVPKNYKPPRFLEELRIAFSNEGSVNLECKVIGVPQPQLKWFKDGQELNPGDMHKIISGQSGTCCLGTYTCQARNCMGTVSSSATLLTMEDKSTVKSCASEEYLSVGNPLVRNESLSTIPEERTSQMEKSYTIEEPADISFSFDGKEVTVSLYETPDLTHDEALQIIEMYADELSEHISEDNVVDLPSLRIVKESSISGPVMMEALVIDVPVGFCRQQTVSDTEFDGVSLAEDTTIANDEKSDSNCENSLEYFSDHLSSSNSKRDIFYSASETTPKNSPLKPLSEDDGHMSFRTPKLFMSDSDDQILTQLNLDENHRPQSRPNAIGPLARFESNNTEEEVSESLAEIENEMASAHNNNFPTDILLLQSNENAVHSSVFDELRSHELIAGLALEEDDILKIVSEPNADEFLKYMRIILESATVKIHNHESFSFPNTPTELERAIHALHSLAWKFVEETEKGNIKELDKSTADNVLSLMTAINASLLALEQIDDPFGVSDNILNEIQSSVCFDLETLNNDHLSTLEMLHQLSDQITNFTVIVNKQVSRVTEQRVIAVLRNTISTTLAYVKTLQQNCSKIKTINIDSLLPLFSMLQPLESILDDIAAIDEVPDNEHKPRPQLKQLLIPPISSIAFSLDNLNNAFKNENLDDDHDLKIICSRINDATHQFMALASQGTKNNNLAECFISFTKPINDLCCHLRRLSRSTENIVSSDYGSDDKLLLDFETLFDELMMDIDTLINNVNVVRDSDDNVNPLGSLLEPLQDMKIGLFQVNQVFLSNQTGSNMSYEVVSCFEHLSQQLVQLNNCIVNQSIVEETDKEIPFESSIKMMQNILFDDAIDDLGVNGILFGSVMKPLLQLQSMIVSKMASVESDLSFSEHTDVTGVGDAQSLSLSISNNAQTVLDKAENDSLKQEIPELSDKIAKENGMNNNGLQTNLSKVLENAAINNNNTMNNSTQQKNVDDSIDGVFQNEKSNVVLSESGHGNSDRDVALDALTSNAEKQNDFVVNELLDNMTRSRIGYNMLLNEKNTDSEYQIDNNIIPEQVLEYFDNVNSQDTNTNVPVDLFEEIQETLKNITQEKHSGIEEKCLLGVNQVNTKELREKCLEVVREKKIEVNNSLKKSLSVEKMESLILENVGKPIKQKQIEPFEDNSNLCRQKDGNSKTDQIQDNLANKREAIGLSNAMKSNNSKEVSEVCQIICATEKAENSNKCMSDDSGINNEMSDSLKTKTEDNDFKIIDDTTVNTLKSSLEEDTLKKEFDLDTNESFNESLAQHEVLTTKVNDYEIEAIVEDIEAITNLTNKKVQNETLMSIVSETNFSSESVENMSTSPTELINAQYLKISKEPNVELVDESNENEIVKHNVHLNDNIIGNTHPIEGIKTETVINDGFSNVEKSGLSQADIKVIENVEESLVKENVQEQFYLQVKVIADLLVDPMVSADMSIDVQSVQTSNENILPVETANQMENDQYMSKIELNETSEKPIVSKNDLTIEHNVRINSPLIKEVLQNEFIQDSPQSIEHDQIKKINDDIENIEQTQNENSQKSLSVDSSSEISEDTKIEIADKTEKFTSSNLALEKDESDVSDLNETNINENLQDDLQKITEHTSLSEKIILPESRENDSTGKLKIDNDESNVERSILSSIDQSVDEVQKETRIENVEEFIDKEQENSHVIQLSQNKNLNESDINDKVEILNETVIKQTMIPTETIDEKNVINVKTNFTEKCLDVSQSAEISFIKRDEEKFDGIQSPYNTDLNERIQLESNIMDIESNPEMSKIDLKNEQTNVENNEKSIINTNLITNEYTSNEENKNINSEHGTATEIKASSEIKIHEVETTLDGKISENTTTEQFMTTLNEEKYVDELKIVDKNLKQASHENNDMIINDKDQSTPTVDSENMKTISQELLSTVEYNAQIKSEIVTSENTHFIDSYASDKKQSDVKFENENKENAATEQTVVLDDETTVEKDLKPLQPEDELEYTETGIVKSHSVDISDKIYRLKKDNVKLVDVSSSALVKQNPALICDEIISVESAELIGATGYDFKKTEKRQHIDVAENVSEANLIDILERTIDTEKNNEENNVIEVRREKDIKLLAEKTLNVSESSSDESNKKGSSKSVDDIRENAEENALNLFEEKNTVSSDIANEKFELKEAKNEKKSTSVTFKDNEKLISILKGTSDETVNELETKKPKFEEDDNVVKTLSSEISYLPNDSNEVEYFNNVKNDSKDQKCSVFKEENIALRNTEVVSADCTQIINRPDIRFENSKENYVDQNKQVAQCETVNILENFESLEIESLRDNAKNTTFDTKESKEIAALDQISALNDMNCGLDQRNSQVSINECPAVVNEENFIMDSIQSLEIKDMKRENVNANVTDSLIENVEITELNVLESLPKNIENVKESHYDEVSVEEPTKKSNVSKNIKINQSLGESTKEEQSKILEKSYDVENISIDIDKTKCSLNYIETDNKIGEKINYLTDSKFSTNKNESNIKDSDENIQKSIICKNESQNISDINQENTVKLENINIVETKHDDENKSENIESMQKNNKNNVEDVEKEKREHFATKNDNNKTKISNEIKLNNCAEVSMSVLEKNAHLQSDIIPEDETTELSIEKVANVLCVEPKLHCVEQMACKQTECVILENISMLNDNEQHVTENIIERALIKHELNVAAIGNMMVNYDSIKDNTSNESNQQNQTENATVGMTDEHSNEIELKNVNILTAPYIDLATKQKTSIAELKESMKNFTVSSGDRKKNEITEPDNKEKEVENKKVSSKDIDKTEQIESKLPDSTNNESKSPKSSRKSSTISMDGKKSGFTEPDNTEKEVECKKVSSKDIDKTEQIESELPDITNNKSKSPKSSRKSSTISIDGKRSKVTEPDNMEKEIESKKVSSKDIDKTEQIESELPDITNNESKSPKSSRKSSTISMDDKKSGFTEPDNTEKEVECKKVSSKDIDKTEQIESELPDITNNKSKSPKSSRKSSTISIDGKRSKVTEPDNMEKEIESKKVSSKDIDKTEQIESKLPDSTNNESKSPKSSRKSSTISMDDEKSEILESDNLKKEYGRRIKLIKENEKEEIDNKPTQIVENIISTEKQNVTLERDKNVEQKPQKFLNKENEISEPLKTSKYVIEPISNITEKKVEKSVIKENKDDMSCTNTKSHSSKPIEEINKINDKLKKKTSPKSKKSLPPENLKNTNNNKTDEKLKISDETVIDKNKKSSTNCENTEKISENIGFENIEENNKSTTNALQNEIAKNSSEAIKSDLSTDNHIEKNIIDGQSDKVTKKNENNTKPTENEENKEKQKRKSAKKKSSLKLTAQKSLSPDKSIETIDNDDSKTDEKVKYTVEKTEEKPVSIEKLLEPSKEISKTPDEIEKNIKNPETKTKESISHENKLIDSKMGKNEMREYTQAKLKKFEEDESVLEKNKKGQVRIKQKESPKLKNKKSPSPDKSMIRNFDDTKTKYTIDGKITSNEEHTKNQVQDDPSKISPQIFDDKAAEKGLENRKSERDKRSDSESNKSDKDRVREKVSDDDTKKRSPDVVANNEVLRSGHDGKYSDDVSFSSDDGRDRPAGKSNVFREAHSRLSVALDSENGKRTENARSDRSEYGPMTIFRKDMGKRDSAWREKDFSGAKTIAVSGLRRENTGKKIFRVDYSPKTDDSLESSRVSASLRHGHDFAKTPSRCFLNVSDAYRPRVASPTRRSLTPEPRLGESRYSSSSDRDLRASYSRQSSPYEARSGYGDRQSVDRRHDWSATYRSPSDTAVRSRGSSSDDVSYSTYLPRTRRGSDSFLHDLGKRDYSYYSSWRLLDCGRSSTYAYVEDLNRTKETFKRLYFCVRLVDQTVCSGSRVKFWCSVIGYPEPRVEWYRDGQKLNSFAHNSSARYRAKYADGLAQLIVDGAQSRDSGQYSCVATNGRDRASTTGFLTVYTSPSAFGASFPARTPLRPPSPVDDYRPKRYDRLYLWNGDKSDDAEFGCSDPRSAAVRRCTRHPKFVTTVLGDDVATRGGTIALQVRVQGSPLPNVTWMRESKPLPRSSNKYVYLDEGGLYTLLVKDSTARDGGVYVCRACNLYGAADVEKTVKVVSPQDYAEHRGVKPAIIVSRPNDRLNVAVGEDIIVTLRVAGNPKPKVIWMRGSRDVTFLDRSLKETVNDYVKLSIKKAQMSDAGTYFIIAKNVYGSDRAFVTVGVRKRARSLTPPQIRNTIGQWPKCVRGGARGCAVVNEIPGPVRSEPKVSDRGNNRITLTWEKPERAETILVYRVDSWSTQQQCWTQIGMTPTNDIDVYNLRPGYRYKFRVTARNRFGWGQPVVNADYVDVVEPKRLPEFSQPLPGETKVLLRHGATLQCHVRGVPKPQITWFKDGEPLVDGKYLVEYTDRGKCTLTITNAVNEDNGRYSCEAINDQGRVFTLTVVEVIANRKLVEAERRLQGCLMKNNDFKESTPIFTKRLTDRRVEINSTVRLSCQVNGLPVPLISWYKDGEPIDLTSADHTKSCDDTHRFSTLELTEVKYDDSGVYSAIASNPIGTASTQCVLEVINKNRTDPSVPEFVFNLPSNYEATNSIILGAQINAYRLVKTEWFKDGIRLRNGRRVDIISDHDGKQELRVANVTKRDSGIYMLKVSNDTGTVESRCDVNVVENKHDDEGLEQFSMINHLYSKKPKFVMKPKFQEVEEGQEVIIDSEIVGDPLPKITWLRDGLKPEYYRDNSEFQCIADGNRYRLKIPHVKLSHTGTYTLLAANTHGQIKALISLQVYSTGHCKKKMENGTNHHTTVERLPRICQELVDIECCNNDNVTFECKLSITPETDVRWQKDGKLVRLGKEYKSELVDGNTARLHISTVSPMHAGLYTCTAFNELGQNSTSAQLILSNSQDVKSTPCSDQKKTMLSSPLLTGEPNDRTSKRLKRSSAPKFYAVLHDKIADVGETVRFQCSVSGHPPPWSSWEKDDMPIGINSRMRIREDDDHRSLEICDITADDAGLYRITVENKFGKIQTTARLEVLTHNQSNDVQITTPNGRRQSGSTACTGENFTLSCDISGNSMSNVTWYKDNKEVKPSDRVTFDQNELTARLSISNLESTDTGVYTCIARCESGVTRCSSELSVFDTKLARDSYLQPPIFVEGLVPKCAVDEGQRVELIVKLQGAVPMSATWFKDEMPIVDCEYFAYVVGDDGRFGLSITDPFNTDSGTYSCRVLNTFGEAVSCCELVVNEITTSELPVQRKDVATEFNNNLNIRDNTNELTAATSPATILWGPCDTTVMRGARVVLETSYAGFPEPEIRWLRAGKTLESNEHMCINNADGISSLTIDSITADDCGKYVVRVDNGLGSEYHFASVAVEGPPDPPAGRPVVSVSETSADVTWSSPAYDGGCKVTGYGVEVRPFNQSEWKLVADKCYSLSHIVRGLAPGESYVFRVRAENMHGSSEASLESIPVYILQTDYGNTIEPKKVNIESGDLFTSQYELLDELGKGRYGVVFKVKERESNKYYAAKFVRCIKSKDKEKAQEEVDIMNCLRHPKLLQLDAAFENPREVVMVTEYISGGELFERVVADDFTLTEKDCILFTRQICEGVDYMHRQNVVHLDLKPENIMCQSRTSHQIKLIDFGLAQKIQPGKPIRVLFGTPEFIPPEIISYEPIGLESDMWSVGVICYVLLSGLSPFMGDNDAETFTNITKAEFDFDDEAFDAISQDSKDFISELLVKRKEKRLTAKECLKHKWLAQQDMDMSCVILSTDKLKKFIIRRKWQKTGNAIRALGRMAHLSAASRRGGGAAGGGGIFQHFKMASLSEEESAGESSPSPSPPHEDDYDRRPSAASASAALLRRTTVTSAKKIRGGRSCDARSDSGISDCSSLASSTANVRLQHAMDDKPSSIVEEKSPSPSVAAATVRSSSSPPRRPAPYAATTTTTTHRPVPAGTGVCQAKRLIFDGAGRRAAITDGSVQQTPRKDAVRVQTTDNFKKAVAFWKQ